jgi:hypothetical protein
MTDTCNASIDVYGGEVAVAYCELPAGHTENDPEDNHRARIEGHLVIWRD